MVTKRSAKKLSTPKEDILGVDVPKKKIQVLLTLGTFR